MRNSSTDRTLTDKTARVIDSNADTSLEERTARWFGENGPLHQTLENYSVRNEQLQMAKAVANSLDKRNTLIVEAGTGTGKSLAYLLPAMLSGGKIIISTGTKNLQDQLFNKDIPTLLGLLRHPMSVSLLKGRSNYLCLHRLKLAESEPKLHYAGSAARRKNGNSPWLTLRSLREWGYASADGDLNAGDAPRLDIIPLSRVTSTTENCLGSECPEYSDCFVMKARRRAQEADIVVVNHHLLLADLALREEGFAELLPDADAVILDEAHQLPQVASQFFGNRYSYYQLAELARDLRAELRDSATDMPSLRDALGEYEEGCAQLHTHLLGAGVRKPWADTVSNSAVNACVEDFVSAVEELMVQLEPARVRSKGLEQASKRIKALRTFFRTMQAEDEDDEAAVDEGENKTPSGMIRWLEQGERNFILHLTPLDIAENFRQIMTSTSSAWVMTSATLSVNHGFRHFAEQIGAEDAQELILESPFDYQRNALLYLPNTQYEPNHPAYLQAIAENIEAVIRSAGGGAFVLCTSINAVNYLSNHLRGRLEQQVLAQGEASRHLLLEQFRDDGHAVLVGTSSFWEGVDVRGPALRLVIIDRLPFAHPGDPIMKARLDTIRKQGGNPFSDYQVPQAVISLKQGVGRLIRDTGDRGVIMLCDPRINSKSYGRIFLNSLPDMPQTRSLSEVTDFLENTLDTA